jgi:tripeptide aminopeptidase
MDKNIGMLLQLIKIPGESTREDAICAFLREQFLKLGVPRRCIRNDETYKQSEYGGKVGNLIVSLEGHGRGERRMLSTHMDTVPGAVGSRPALKGRRIVNRAAGKALGGDARCGCACLLAAARALLERRGNHPPRTVVFFVQEELGLVGSRGLDTRLLGRRRPAMCFNFDGGDAREVSPAVIGTERLHVTIHGVACHTSRPQKGISAAVIEAEALADLQANGWVGAVDKSQGRATSNLGILRGGTGSNVLMPELYALAEARSFGRAFRSRVISAWKDAFRKAVKRANARAAEAEGKASVDFKPGPIYDPYRLPENAPVVRAAVAAIRKLGMEPHLFDHWGGMDCNNVVSKGIPAVGLGMGDNKAHSVEEWVNVPEFLKACELAVELATG